MNETSSLVLAKDENLEKFLNEIGKENPDMSIIKEGIKKFGLGHFSAAKEEMIVKAIFPQQTGQTKTESLGFENTASIKNTLKAVEELVSEKELSFKDANKVLGIKFDNISIEDALKNNKEMAEAKLLKSPKLQEALKNNLQNYIQAQEKYQNTTALVKADKTASTEYGMVKYSEANQDTNDESGLTIGGEEKSITVDAKPKETTVNAAPQEEKVADMMPQAGNDKSRRPFDFKFEKVREQDIIQYMFNEWFLEGVTLALKAPFWLVNKAIDALESRYDSTVPKAPKYSANLPKNGKAIDFLNQAGPCLAADYMDAIQKKGSYHQAIYDTIRSNIGKKPEEWNIKEVDGKPVFNVKADKKKLNRLNTLYSQDKTGFMNKLELANSIPQEEIGKMTDIAKLASEMAVAKYMAKNPDGPFSDKDVKCKDALQKGTIEYYRSLVDVINTIYKTCEQDYMSENKISEGQKLTTKQQDEIAKKAGNAYKKFINPICKEVATIKDVINNYHQENSEEDRKTIKKGMESAINGFEKGFPKEYLDNAGIDSSKIKIEKSTLRDATVANNFSEITGKQAEETLKAMAEATMGDLGSIKKRKENVERTKNAIFPQNKGNTQTSTHNTRNGTGRE